MKVKEESEKAGLKLNIQKTKIMVSSPITQWQIEREKVEARTYFIWAPKSLWTVTMTFCLVYTGEGKTAWISLCSLGVL